jgi:anti-sigma28 factor (negative regulator of flagellin synthesis)
MKLEKINRLFAAYPTNAPATPTKTVEEKQIADAASQVQEAVKVASDFGTAASSTAAADNRAKVERIKAEVKDGTYKADSKEVAKALVRDLFA